MALRKEDKKFIKKHPLSVDQDVWSALAERTAATRHASPEHEGVLTRRDAILDLLETFQVHPMAKRLQYSQRPINKQLVIINARAQSEAFDLSPFAPLTELVVSKAIDIAVWHTVL